MNSQNLWVAENRPRSETKIKKSMIEIDLAGAKDVKVKYMLFKVSARVSGRKLLVASVNKIEELSLNVLGLQFVKQETCMEKMERGHDGTQNIPKQLMM